jgi:hypothetical protein
VVVVALVEIKSASQVVLAVVAAVVPRKPREVLRLRLAVTEMLAVKETQIILPMTLAVAVVEQVLLEKMLCLMCVAVMVEQV